MSHRSTYQMKDLQLLGNMRNLEEALKELKITFEHSKNGFDITLKGKAVAIALKDGKIEASGYDIYDKQGILDRIAQKANVIYIQDKLRSRGFMIQQEKETREQEVLLTAVRYR